MTSTASTAVASTNAETVKGIYEAFGKGDIPGILEQLADDVAWEEWADSFGQRAGVPWLQPRTGRDGAADFFGVVGQMEITEFSVLDVIAGDKQVAAEVVIEATTPGGGRFRDEEIHLWSFNDEGKISRMRHYTDTSKHAAASKGEDTTAR